MLLVLLPVQNVVYGQSRDYKQGSGKGLPGKIAPYFRPPSEFAGASDIPLAAAVSSHAQVLRPLVKDDDDYLDELVADVKPIRNPLEDGGISNAFVVVMVLLATVISVAAVVTAALV